MKYFLELVAENLIAQYGNNLSQLVLVFPNKRASLFLNRHLEHLLNGQVIWAPQYMTISELFLSLSDKTPADDTETICRLYNIYIHHTHSSETLDHFYSWGERLLSDFDDIDKNLSLKHKTSEVFCNIEDLKKLENNSYITKEQREELESFFNTRKKKKGINNNFFTLWDHLNDIYEALNEELSAQGEAYEGALYRSVIKNLQNEEISCTKEVDKYVFIGLNVLDYVEHELLSWLYKKGKAQFFWDYDTFYVQEHPEYEAGTFIRQDLTDFPNSLPQDFFHNLTQEKEEFEVIQAPGENIQAYSVAEWLQPSEGHLNLDNQPNTAIILCNEELTEPVLHSLPNITGKSKNGEDLSLKVNITKGFQLPHTPIYTEVDRLLTMAERSKRNRSQEQILLLIQKLIDWYALKNLKFSQEEYKKETEKVDDDKQHQFTSLLYTEAYYKVHTTLEHFLSLIRNRTLQVTIYTLHRLINQVLNKISIPFHGNPIDGIQVMGVLESRNLDFDNILLLSVNEGMIPKLESENSFIPYTLRRTFGLTSSEKKNAVYAYYFYRLLQRARKVRILYNITTSVTAAEPSRFLQQLIVSRLYSNIRHKKLVDTPKTISFTEDSVTKPKNLFDILNPLINTNDKSAGRKMLSPSSLNNYIDCPLKFYYQRVAGLHIPDPAPDDIQANSFGKIFHGSAELLYKTMGEYDERKKKFLHPNLSSELIKSWIHPSKKPQLRAFIEQTYQKENITPNTLVTELVLSYLENLLLFDSKLNSLKLLALEKYYGTQIEVNVNGEKRKFNIGGIIDRLDIANYTVNEKIFNTTRIVDYKTSKSEQTAKDVESIFNADARERPSYLFQTLLYTLAVKGRITDPDKYSAVLFYPHLAQKAGYDPWIKIGTEHLHSIPSEILERFNDNTKELLNELLDTSLTFDATPSESHCRFCDFKQFCGQAITSSDK